jgi:hypothetical protein
MFLDLEKLETPVVPDRYYLDNAHTVKVMSKVYCKVQTLARKMLQVIAGSVEHWAGLRVVGARQLSRTSQLPDACSLVRPAA